MDTPTLVISRLSLTLCVGLGGAQAVLAQTPGHVRSSDAGLKALTVQGERRSAALRALVDRLDQSNVVVYLECSVPLQDAFSQLPARLTFVGSGGGVRYTVARVNCALPVVRQTELIAHELRHAVEIADAPEIVDVPTFARYYARWGVAGMNDGRHRLFETIAAQVAEAAVRRDLGRDAAVRLTTSGPR